MDPSERSIEVVDKEDSEDNNISRAHMCAPELKRTRVKP